MISLKRRQNVENGVLRSHATQELVYLFGNYSNYCYTLCVCDTYLAAWQLDRLRAANENINHNDSNADNRLSFDNGQQ